SFPEDHMADFHHLDDAREIWLAVKARFGGNEESKKMRKTMLKALPPSWSQVSLTLKTRGGLEYLSFDDLYNKLRSLEIDVKGGSSYGSRNTIVAPTHSAFIDVLHSFVAENEPTQQLAYEDFEQVDQLEMEELDIKWQMAMLSLRINKFQKKVDFKAMYSAFKISEVKTEEPKAMVSVDSMLNWNEHDAENKTKEAEQVYGLMAGFESDFAVYAGNAAGGVNPAAAEFSMMGISPKYSETLYAQAKIEKQEWEIKFVESLASVAKSLEDPDWVAAMEEEMQQFYHQQVYVDDIIFSSTNKAWCDEFEVLMKGEFERSAMGELTFFLGLQLQ
nr:uncharacterized mitochondrial protein AtMg00810-like [Tanacetum cinerariifolium]